MAAMTSLRTERCCYLVSEHEAPAGVDAAAFLPNVIPMRFETTEPWAFGSG